MRQFNEYDLIIFDCDGVILNSNQLKIDAMENTLISIGCSNQEVKQCTLYFAGNFGKSRFYHIDYFINHLINMAERDIEETRTLLLESFSNQCKKLYLKADITDGITTVLEKSQATKCVASGSEQGELQEIFSQRRLSNYFSLILGSPDKKNDLVSRILLECTHNRAVMIGDAISDLEAAISNDIDFVYYSPLSNVDVKMRVLCTDNNFRVIDSFKEVLGEL